MGEALCRGSTYGALCEACPFAVNGQPNDPVVSEYPNDPLWILLGEGPGWTEKIRHRPFVGPSGQVVDKILRKIGRPRDHVFIGNVTLCIPPQNASVPDREKAAECCKPRLQNELIRFPKKPILLLGAVATRAVIPRDALDAVDPPEARKKDRKRKFAEDGTRQAKIDRAVEKLVLKHYRSAVKERKQQIVTEIRESRRAGRSKVNAPIDWDYVCRRIDREDAARMWETCQVRGAAEYVANEENKKLKKQAKRKPKRIKITDVASTLFDVDVDGTGVRAVIPAVHPAALLRGGGGASIGGSHTPDMAFVNLCYDAGKIDALAKGKPIRLALNCVVEVEDPERATALFVAQLKDAIAEGTCAVDLETYVEDPDRNNALQAYVAKIRIIGIATSARSIAIAWDLIAPWALDYFQFALGAIPIVTHHGIYDRTILRAYGFVIPIDGHDSLYAHHAAFPGNAHDLQSVTAQFFGVPCWKAEFRNSEETSIKLATYCACDSASTLADVKACEIWVKRTETEEIYARDRKMAEIAGRMHLNGMPVSREVNKLLVDTFLRNAKESRAKLEDRLRDRKFVDNVRDRLAMMLATRVRKDDPEDQEERIALRKSQLKPNWKWKINAAKHVAAYLQTCGVPLFQMTGGGQLSTKKDILERLVDHQVVKELLEYRENSKMLDFVWPLFDRVVDGQTIPGFADGNDRIHPIWTIHKISGRWAGSQPHGTSNPPREKSRKTVVLPPGAIVLHRICAVCGKYDDDPVHGVEHAFEFGKYEYAARPTTKRQIVAPPGRILIGFDFAQIEARIIALISGDEFMCHIFSINGDLHSECARDVFAGFDTKTPSERKMARTVCKTLEYATWYGADDETVWQGLVKEGFNVKLSDTKHSLAILRRKMSGVIRWQADTIRRASIPPYELRDVVSGRRRVWPMGQVDQGEALNSVPQFTGSAIMNRGLELMDDRLVKYKEAFPIVQVHDAAVYEAWEDDADAIAKDIDECFTYEHTNHENGKTVKFPVEIGIGQSWADV